MKINIPPEKLKKGCELIDDKYGYQYSDRYILIYSNKITLCEMDISNSKFEPLYRDFIQLVIEAINKKYFGVVEISNTYCSIDITIWVTQERVIQNSFRFKYYTTTEAKEQAIIYCLDNMEV